MRGNITKINFNKYVKVLSQLPPLLAKEAETVNGFIEKCNVETDIESFVNQNKTHQEVPEPFEYEPYQQGNQQPKTKTSEKLKRFIKTKAIIPLKSEVRFSIVSLTN